MTLSHARTEPDADAAAVEFIDSPAAGVGGSGDVDTGSAWSWLAVVMVIAAGVWAVSAFGVSVQGKRGGSVAPAIAGRGIEPVVRPSFVIARSGPQPSPEPGSQQLETTLVYLATDGVPVVVSLDTGRIDVIDIDPERPTERFAVVDDSRVTFDPERPTEGFAVIDASRVTLEWALDVNEHRVVFDVVSDANGRRALCARRDGGADPSESCTGVAILVSDGVTVERYDTGRHWRLAPVLEAASVVGRRLVTDDGFWLPVPLPSSIWVIGPTEQGGAAADVGRL